MDQSSSEPTDEPEEEPSQEEEEETTVSSTIPSTVPPTEITNLHSKSPVVVSSTNSARRKPVIRYQKRQRKQKNPSQPPLKYLVIPPLDSETINKQQERLNLFLNRTRDYQSTGLNDNRVVFYKIHRESGLGNMIRGYITSLAVALLTNRSIQCKNLAVFFYVVKVQRNFFFRFFVPPFPSMTASYSSKSHMT